MKRTERGYSLIELLVVLALLGVISIAISGGIHLGARVWDRVQTTAEGSDRIRGTQNFLRALIGRIYPRQPDTTAESGDALFQGDATRLSFLSLAPDNVGDGMVVRVALEVEGASGATRLIMKRQGEGDAISTRTLLNDAQRVTFSFGSAQPNGDIVWTDTWDEKTGIPQLVRIRANFDHKTNDVWPDLIVHPMIDREAGCIYDPVSFSCRHG